MASDILLYWASGSIPPWKPSLVLEEKGLQGYRKKLVSFSKNEHKSEEILKLNPRGQIPTFRDGDVVINESTAICEYLEYKFESQGTQLLPKDPAKRGAVLQRMHETMNLFKYLIEAIVYFILQSKPEDITEEALEEKRKAARVELQRWEDYLKVQGEGTYIVGNEFTMADIFLFPIVAFGVRGDLDLGPYPALNEYYQLVVKRPSVQATWPPHWKEEPGKGFFKGV